MARKDDLVKMSNPAIAKSNINTGRVTSYAFDVRIRNDARTSL